MINGCQLEAKAARTVVFVYYSGPQTVDDRIEILRKIDDEVAAEDERKAEVLRKAQDKRKAEAGGGCKAEDEREAGGGGSPLRGYVGDELKRLKRGWREHQHGAAAGEENEDAEGQVSITGMHTDGRRRGRE